MLATGWPGTGRWALRLAWRLTGPYKDRRLLAQLTSRPVVSPFAQVQCADLTIGPGSFIDDQVVIYSHTPDSGVRIGSGVYIYRGTIIEVGQGGRVEIDDGCHIQAGCNLKGFLGSLRIGRHVQIAPRCAFSPYDHNFDDLDRPIRQQGIHTRGGIVIEDDVWLGVGVTVLDGVTIGRGAVIGAGSVVTDRVAPYAIVAGVPARLLRYRGRGGQGSREAGEKPETEIYGEWDETKTQSDCHHASVQGSGDAGKDAA